MKVINLKELKENVEFIYSNLNEYEKPEDLSVVITLSEPSVGARACVAVTSIHRGFDWEHNRIDIGTDTKLVRKGKSKEDIVEPYISEEDYGTGRKTIIRSCKMCGSHVKKDNKYCCNCGQKLR